MNKIARNKGLGSRFDPCHCRRQQAGCRDSETAAFLRFQSDWPQWKRTGGNVIFKRLAEVKTEFRCEAAGLSTYGAGVGFGLTIGTGSGV